MNEQRNCFKSDYHKAEERKRASQQSWLKFEVHSRSCKTDVLICEHLHWLYEWLTHSIFCIPNRFTYQKTYHIANLQSSYIFLVRREMYQSFYIWCTICKVSNLTYFHLVFSSSIKFLNSHLLFFSYRIYSVIQWLLFSKRKS